MVKLTKNDIEHILCAPIENYCKSNDSLCKYTLMKCVESFAKGQIFGSGRENLVLTLLNKMELLTLQEAQALVKIENICIEIRNLEQRDMTDNQRIRVDSLRKKRFALLHVNNFPIPFSWEKENE